MSGKPDFGPGDLVVCVDDGPGIGGVARGQPVSLRRGAVYRVKSLTPPGTMLYGVTWGTWHVRLLGLEDSSFPLVGFSARRFRKIDRADDSFTELMRACRPAGVMMRLRRSAGVKA